ncbi:MAG: tetratricopeptide repeat protein [Methanotrichaceae archaeon]|nr:tetratricopeptide repeat protein [Methanotrichaceae archaeon]
MKFVVVVAIASIALSIPAFGQTTAEDWFNKGMNLSNQSKYGDALVAFDKAIELNPQYADAWRIKGAILTCLGKYDEAIKDLDKAIQMDPQDALVWTNIGFTLYCEGRYIEALQVYDRAIQLNPKLAEASVGRGFALLALGFSGRRFEANYNANKAFDLAIALVPNYGIAWIGKWSTINRGEGEYYGSAADTLDKAVTLNPIYATDLLYSEYSSTLGFQREVFLKEGCAQISARQIK